MSGLWNIAIAFVPLFVLVFPPTRLAVTWAAVFMIGPFIAWRQNRNGLRFEPVRVEQDDPRVPIAVWIGIDRETAQAQALGLREAITYYTSVNSRFLRVNRLFCSDVTRTIVSVQFLLNQGSQRRLITMMTLVGDTPIITNDAIENQVFRHTNARAYVLPSLHRLADHWTMHEAIVRQRREAEPGAGFEELPADADGWMSKATREIQVECAALVARGTLSSVGDRGYRVRFLAGAIMGWKELWPWIQRRKARAHAQEARIASEVGLAELLARARSPEQQKGRVDAFSLARDDAGVPCRISAFDTSDERASDPRFLATLRQAQSARQNTNQTSRVIISLVVLVVGMFAAVGLGVPFWMAMIVVPIASIALISVGSVEGVTRREREAADAYLRTGLCASCLYSLANLTPTPRGLLVCPECNASWRRDRVQEFMVFSAGSSGNALSAGVRVLDTAFALGVGSRFRDDRGVQCTLVHPRLGTQIPLASGQYRERLLIARARIGRSGRLVRWACALLLLLFLCSPMIILAITGMLWRAPVFASILMLLAVVFAVAIVRGNFAYRRRDIRRAMLEQSMCPSCANELSKAIVEPDGLARCRCSASWRVTPPTVPLARN